MSNKQTVVIRGKASFAKILGDPVLNFNKDGKEWKLDIEITEETKKEMKGLGLLEKVREKDGYLSGNPFMTFKQPEFQKSGKPNEPIKVVDIIGKPWDQNKLIGNGSTIEVNFQAVDYGKGKRKGAYIRSVRILDLLEYAKADFAPLDKNDEFYEAAKAAEERNAREYEQFKKDFSLDDQVDDIASDEDDEVM